MRALLNWKLVGLVLFVAGAAVAVWISGLRRPATDPHRQGRHFALSQTLSRNAEPVIVLGDSLVEASTLPRAVCGRAIVNAGLNGASTGSDLGRWLATALGGRPAAAIVVSLGINDAQDDYAPSAETFASNYGALRDQLAKLSPRLAVLEIAPVEVEGRLPARLAAELTQTVKNYNLRLREVAASRGASFVALPAMASPFTVDGVHLNANGYLAWDRAVMQAAGAVCG